VEETSALWVTESCPYCGAKLVGGYDDAPERKWRHLNVCQLESEILKLGTVENIHLKDF
jgi:hypothetical protein